jgi:hypothetical protein
LRVPRQRWCAALKLEDAHVVPQLVEQEPSPHPSIAPVAQGVTCDTEQPADDDTGKCDNGFRSAITARSIDAA